MGGVFRRTRVVTFQAALLCLLAAPPFQRGARAAGEAAAPAKAADAAAPGPAGYNFILVVVDCLRADHLSLYGYHRKTSPNIDALAGEAAVFTQAVAPAPTTLLSFASIFTSRRVSAHGVSGLNKALGDSALTLAEILKIYNYRTGAYMAGVNLNPVFRLDQGFDDYYQLNYTSASFRDTLPAALAWARARRARGEKFFLVAHGNDLHTPYVFPSSGLYDKGFRVNPRLARLPPMEAQLLTLYRRKLMLKSAMETIKLSDDDVNHLVARYDEGIRYADGLLGGFLAGLRAGKLLDNTVLIVTADHGEGLFNHDYFFHDFSLYDDTLRVPLIIKLPGGGKKEIARQVQLIDLMPTVLELAGIPPAWDAQGRSLVPLLAGAPEPGAEPAAVSGSGVSSQSIRREGRKLILSGKKAELYDLAKDPGEREDISARETAAAGKLSGELRDTLAADEKDSCGEPLPAGAGFTTNMNRAEAELRDFFDKAPGLGRKRF